MIKATAITENDSVQTETSFEGTSTNILNELAALNATIIRQLLDNPLCSFQNVDNVLEILRGLTKQGLDNYEEVMEHEP